MDWPVLDHAFWQTLVTFVAVVAAYLIGRKQIKVQDTVELYGSLFIIENKDVDGRLVSSIPYIHVQDVGTRLVYLDKYVFNGREYLAGSQILPSTYSQAENSFYRIQLPTNEERHVSLEVFYHDLDNRYWSSKLVASREGPFGWEIKTFPRTPSKT